MSTPYSSVPVKDSFNLPSTPSGVSYVLGVITNITGRTALVMTPGNKQVRVRTDRLFAKGASPKEGEYWYLTQPWGDGWVFACTASYPGIDADPTTATPTLINTWVNYSAPGTWSPGNGQYRQAAYALDGLGYTELFGVVKGGTITDSNAAGPITADIFKLPAGFRPGTSGQRRLPVAGGTVLVMPDGFVRAAVGSAALFSLDGCRFLAEQ